jgi:hypothetical protein
LIKSLEAEPSHFIVVEPVRYIDYTTTRIEPADDELAPFFHKAREYDGEHEVRAITSATLLTHDPRLEYAPKPPKPGEPRYLEYTAAKELYFYPGMTIEGNGIPIRVELCKLIQGTVVSNSRPNGVSWPLVGHDGPSGGLSIGFHGSRAKVGKIGCAQESTA